MHTQGQDSLYSIKELGLETLLMPNLGAVLREPETGPKGTARIVARRSDSTNLLLFAQRS